MNAHKTTHITSILFSMFVVQILWFNEVLETYFIEKHVKKVVFH